MSVLKQTNEPLFPEIEWNQPINQRSSGHVLIIGGHSQQFSRTQAVYQYAQQAGTGEATVILPRSLEKVIGKAPGCIFVPNTPAGSLSRNAAAEIQRYISEVDLVLLAGELSQNTETISVLETLLQESETQFVVTNDILRSLLHTPETLENASTLIGTPQTLSEIAKKHNIPVHVKTPDLQKEQKLLAALGEVLPSVLVCYTEDHVLVGYNDRASLTFIDDVDTAQLAAFAAIFFMQHTQKFEAVTTAVYQLSDNSQTTDS